MSIDLMWDFKLFIINISFLASNGFFYIFSFLLDLFNSFLSSSFWLVNWQIGITLPQNFALIFGIKFCFAICFLILIRGGTPRYRYDFLTKLGWLKFLSLILLVLIFSIFTLFLY